MAATDRVTPEASKGVILVLAVPCRRALACQKGQHLRRGDRVAGRIAVGISDKAAQDARPGCELRAMGAAPDDVLFDCFAQRHASPSRSRAATSRRAARLTLA